MRSTLCWELNLRASFSASSTSSLFALTDCRVFPDPQPCDGCLQAAKLPHGNLSAAEVEGSVRSVEHLLWLTQRSRATLGTLGDTYRHLSSLHAALCTLGPAQGEQQQQQQQAAAFPLPPQQRCWAWYQQQRRSLAGLVEHSEETSELLAAAGATETAASPRRLLQQGAQQAAAAAAAVCSCVDRLAVAGRGAVQLAADSSATGAEMPPFLSPAVLSALQANAVALLALQQDLAAAGEVQEQQDGAALPGWAALTAAVAAAAQESAAAGSQLRSGSPDSFIKLPEQQQQLVEQLEAAVTAALIWAQNAKPAAAEPAAPEPAAAEPTSAAAHAAAAGELDAPEAASEAQEQAEQQQQQQEAVHLPLPALLQQLEQRLSLHKAADFASHTTAVLAAVAAASNLPASDGAREQQVQLCAAAAGLAPMLSLLLCALRQLGLQYLAVHKAVAKLCYISASLFAGLVQEGFCMPEGTEGKPAAGGVE
jgi:midasin